MNTYLISKQKEYCSGCRACEQICPKGCINMVEDEEGFFYPNIDKEKCVNCGKCTNTCPINKDTINGLNLEEPIVYAAWHRNNEILSNSSSGGVFSALAQGVLNKNGVVFGCSLDENMVAKHIPIEGEDNLYKLRGSKYVQSDTGNTYTEVECLLKDRRHVIYTGTPCQIAGLKSFLGHDYENLVTVDLICHGVPSPRVFADYLKYLENKHKAKVADFKFRDKCKYGWGGYGFKYKIVKNSKIYNGSVFGNLSPYGYAFFNNYLQRPICYNCPYTSTKREGDITLADFWGVEKFHPEINANKGISLAIINTKKGEMFFNYLDEKIYKVISTMENGKCKNNHLERPSNKPEIRDSIYTEINKLGFEEVAKRYFAPKNIMLVKMKSMIPMELKRKIRKVCNK